MFESINFISWLWVTIPLLYSPGPVNILCASNGSLVGVRKTIPLIVALQFPAILYSLFIGYGLMTYLLDTPVFIKSAMFCGGIYLFVLTYKMYKSRGNEINSVKAILAKDGMIVSALNGKLIPVLILIFSISLAEGSSLISVLLVTLSTALVGVTANLTWTFIGSCSNRLMGQKSQKIVFSSILAMVGCWLVIQSIQY